MQKQMTDQAKENRKNSGIGMQEELPEDLSCPVLQRSQGRCGPKRPEDLMKNWLTVIFRSVATTKRWR